MHTFEFKCLSSQCMAFFYFGYVFWSLQNEWHSCCSKLLNYYNFKSFIAAFLLLLGMCCVFLFVFCFCTFLFCCWLQWDYLKFVVLSICDAVVCLILLPVWVNVGKLPLLIHSSFLIFSFFLKFIFKNNSHRNKYVTGKKWPWESHTILFVFKVTIKHTQFVLASFRNWCI